MDILEVCLRGKFAHRNLDLREKLKNTQGKILVEAPDRFFGKPNFQDLPITKARQSQWGAHIYYTDESKSTRLAYAAFGRNLAGKAIMRVRDEQLWPDDVKKVATFTLEN